MNIYLAYILGCITGFFSATALLGYFDMRAREINKEKKNQRF